MKSRKYSSSVVLAISMFCSLAAAQQGATTSSATVPRLVNFSGKTADAQGKPIKPPARPATAQAQPVAATPASASAPAAPDTSGDADPSKRRVRAVGPTFLPAR